MEISNLPMGSMPYEEYFPCIMELEQKEKDNPEMFKTYQELCHFYICMDVHDTHGNVNRIKVWADYLFPVLDGALENVQLPIPDDDINQKMVLVLMKMLSWRRMMGSMKRVTGL